MSGLLAKNETGLVPFHRRIRPGTGGLTCDTLRGEGNIEEWNKTLLTT